MNMRRITSLIFALFLFVAGCVPWSAVIPAQGGNTTVVALYGADALPRRTKRDGPVGRLIAFRCAASNAEFIG
jgi:hypothetical protein